MVLKISLPSYLFLVIAITYIKQDRSVASWGVTDATMKRMTFLYLPLLPPPF